MPGYIYIRFNFSYDLLNVCKVGKTLCIPNRDAQYVTGEPIRGYFAHVWEVNDHLLDDIEKEIMEHFQEFNLKNNDSNKFFNNEIIEVSEHYHERCGERIGGTEFFCKQIVSLIEPFLKELGHVFRKLTDEEINNLTRTDTKKILTPRTFQKDIIEKSVAHFQQFDKGLLVLICGVGKTLISLWIAQELNCKKIVIGVYSKQLLKQWYEVINSLFPDVSILLVSGDINSQDIVEFMEDNSECCIVITTYSSSNKINAATKVNPFVFDMKINDECHHLTSHNIKAQKTKAFIEMLDIPCHKQLSLTATLKLLEADIGDNNIVSNDNVDYFGEIIERKGLLWAINENIICDYVIQTITANEEQLEQQLSRFHIIEENDKRLFLSAFASLKSIFDGHSHHLLIYANNKDNSLKLIQYIKMLLDDNYFDIPDLFYSKYHGEIKSKSQEGIIDNFKKAKFGIISCVYCLGEGWNQPLLDGVVFAENMSSDIRIVQSALRPCRKNIHQPDKIAKIILPILNRDEWLENNENPDLKKVREVIYQMGLEDETITQKIKVLKISIDKQKPKPREKEDREMLDQIGEYDEELTHKLRLKTTRRSSLGITYEKAKSILANKRLKSVECYYQLCDQDNRFVKNPEIVFKDKFEGWFDFFSLQRDDYYNLELCKQKIDEYAILDSDIKKNYLDLPKVCNILCLKDSKFPPLELWVECYKVNDLRDIIRIKNEKKKKGACF